MLPAGNSLLGSVGVGNGPALHLRMFFSTAETPTDGRREALSSPHRLEKLRQKETINEGNIPGNFLPWMLYPV